MFQISTGSVVSKRVSRKEMTNSSQEKVIDRKKLAKIAGHSTGTLTRNSTFHSGCAEVARGALDVHLMLAHLAVDDGKAERQVDHHMADAGGEQRFRQCRAALKRIEEAHADDEVADGRAAA